MNLVLSVFVVALCLAVTTPARAAITLGNSQGGSSLVLSVWDNARSVSYTRNLGYTLNTFLPTGLSTLPTDGTPYGTPAVGNMTPASGLTLSLPAPAGDTLFSTAFAASDPANLRWNIVAYDNLSFDAAGLSRVIATATSAPTSTNAGIDNIGVGGFNYLGALLSDPNTASQDAVTTGDPSRPSFAGNPNWGNNLNNGGLDSAASGLSSEIGFYYLARSATTGLDDAQATVFRFANGDQFASWRLSADGTATYTVAAAVPLPASAWLFSAGLAGFIGLARRRRPIQAKSPR